MVGSVGFRRRYPFALNGRLCTWQEDGDVERRSNAILIRGPPIKHLSTDKIFAYTGHYATAAEQIEWIDDESCVLVYSSSSTAMAAFSALKKSRESSSAESGMEGEEEMTMCQPVPALLWPIEERLSKSLGKSQGLTGHIVMRWALKTDVKQRGSRNKSEFYKKHGDPNDTTPLERSKKRRRWDDDDSLASRLDAEPNEHAARAHDRAALDAELDAFVSRGEINAGITASPKEAGSIGSLMDRLGPLIDSREVAPLPRRKGRDGGYGRGPSREQRPTTDKETLDAELDAFLKDREG
ncbi:uncharacterized protein EI90DRAFT_3286521 [Cantharellus anzutake]|uniref:uncharacterized protein n=1 Tax=Cantharellus anzutake TaxID=1750568 RepID=UPI001908BB21|nr:uncharacterized protein EI90DRAFT_3286521 [Cantharellus anzutake]KAF8338958.1 hypothetical protein EI90DRAFT_3286521 [Cantharellus anzutake]